MEIELDLDALSNSVMDTIEARKYDEAERLCQRLLREYPETFDGYQRLGELREAQGRFREAAEQYSKVLDMILKNPAGTDQGTVDYVTEQRNRALAKAKG